MSAPAKKLDLDEIEVLAFYAADLVKLAQQSVADMYNNAGPESSADLGRMEALIFVTADLALRVATGIADLPPAARCG